MGEVERMHSMLKDFNEQVNSAVSSPTDAMGGNRQQDYSHDKSSMDYDSIDNTQRGSRNLSDEFDDSEADESINEEFDEDEIGGFSGNDRGE